MITRRTNLSRVHIVLGLQLRLSVGKIAELAVFALFKSLKKYKINFRNALLKETTFFYLEERKS